MRILITGGLGYIGSHTSVVSLEAGHDMAILDNLCNSNKVVLEQITLITGKKPSFYEGDIRDSNFLKTVFADFQPDAVIHFAGLKSVSESIEEPGKYYDNNVAGTLALLMAMQDSNVKKLVFSSTANLYGNSNTIPLIETASVNPNNPYGRSKLMIETILHDWAAANPDWYVACLRYFNPVGAHKSGLIGENPLNIPSNLMPMITQVACGIQKKLTIFGQDYETPDGTGVRDFIHVMDLAESHLATLNYLSGLNHISNKFFVANIGTGKGTSVLELVLAFMKYTGVAVSYEFLPRRTGDIGVSYADVSFAEQIIGWKARFALEDMCRDAWQWELKNVKNYKS